MFPPMRDARQGSAVDIASSKELLIPSATLGKTKASAARRMGAGSATAPANWTWAAIPRVPARASRRSRSGPWPTRIRFAPVRRTTAGQASRSVSRFFWGWSRPVKTTRGWGRRPASASVAVPPVLFGGGMEVCGVDSARHPDQTLRQHPQVAPLPLDIRRDGGEGRVAEDRPAEQGAPAGAEQLFGLAVIPRARRLDQGRCPGEPAPAQARRHGLPEPLVRVDQVILRAEPPQRGDDPGHEPEAKQAARARRLHPAVDLHSSARLITRCAGDRVRDHMDRVSPPNQLRPLSQRLPLGAAGDRVEVAQDVADTNRGRIEHGAQDGAGAVEDSEPVPILALIRQFSG